MRIVSLINESEVVDLPANGAWGRRGAYKCVRVVPERAPPKLVERILVPWIEDPFPDYDTEPVYLSSEALA